MSKKKKKMTGMGLSTMKTNRVLTNIPMRGMWKIARTQTSRTTLDETRSDKEARFIGEYGRVGGWEGKCVQHEDDVVQKRGRDGSLTCDQKS